MGTFTPIEELDGSRPKSDTVRLRSAHDFTLTVQALTARVEDLKKLAKKNEEEGYKRESRAVAADAEAIERFVLPALRDQRELPLVTVETLENEILGALRPMVQRAFSGFGDPKVQITPSMIDWRRDELLKVLVGRVLQFVTDVADDAFNQGHAAREQTAEAIAQRSIGSLRASDG